MEMRMLSAPAKLCPTTSLRTRGVIVPLAVVATRSLSTSSIRNSRTQRAERIRAQAEEKDKSFLAGGANRVADSVTDFVRPKFVPQPIAKLAIVFYGIGFAFSLFKKFLSLAIFLGLLGSGAYIFLRLQSGGENPDK